MIAATCQQCRTSFEVSDQDIAFYSRFDSPAPNHCPRCRFQRRAQYRNERYLYPRKCDLCQAQIISMYAPNSPYTVYCYACFESDKWDAKSFAQSYDPDRPFLEQFGELSLRVPKKAIYILESENTEYANFGGKHRNCYLIFNCGSCEDTLYSRGQWFTKDSCDMYFGIQNERCYEGVNVHESNGVLFGQNVTNSLDCIFGLNLVDCQNCFGCVNLRHKSYYFFNQPLSKEEYTQKVNSIMGSYAQLQEMKKKFEEFSLQFPRKEHVNVKCEDVTGNYLANCNAVFDSFEAGNCENGRYLFSTKQAKDSYDCIGHGRESELLLDCVATGFAHRVIGSIGVDQSMDIEYCFGLMKCNNCLGCDGMTNAKFSILNKEYSESEYQELRQKIVQELKAAGVYGQILPPKYAPFAYNETIAQDEFPLTQEKAEALDFRWQEQLPFPTGKATLASEHIPDHISAVQPDILKEVFACVSCQRNYKLVAPELALYQRLNLPIPRHCFQCRHLERLNKRGQLSLHQRQCDRCAAPITTTYPAQTPFPVWCEGCFISQLI